MQTPVAWTDRHPFWRKIELVVELVIFGVILGVIEDIIIIRLISEHPITWRIFGIILMVTIPFAILGEVVFDTIDFSRYFRRWFGRGRWADLDWKKVERVFELVVFGIILGVIEDLIAVVFATGVAITWQLIAIIIAVTVPFAILGEIVFDHIDLERWLRKMFAKKNS
jgi:hypothetical protein